MVMTSLLLVTRMLVALVLPSVSRMPFIATIRVLPPLWTTCLRLALMLLGFLAFDLIVSLIHSSFVRDSI